jgi:hypothetical protein
MRVPLLFVVLMTMSFSASCMRSPMLADAGDVVPQRTATDAVMGYVEMPPLYVDASAHYGRKIKKASADATELCARQLNCPAVRVLRADAYQRADGTSWTVVRLNACGEQRVYEQTRHGWNDATSRLR